MSDEKRYVQLSLTSEMTHLVCWVECDARLKRGVVITLKGIDKTKWTIDAVYEHSIMTGSPRRTWKVGGL